MSCKIVNLNDYRKTRRKGQKPRPPASPAAALPIPLKAAA
jgi:hypothetical protein